MKALKPVARSPHPLLADLTDAELVERIDYLNRQSRRTTAALIIHLMEFDARKLYAGLGFTSLFAYCTRSLELSEQCAYRRIYAARLAIHFPIVLKFLAEGKLHLEALALIGPHLRPENCLARLSEAVGKSCRQLQSMAADISPLPDVGDHIQALPARISEPEEQTAKAALIGGSSSGERALIPFARTEATAKPDQILPLAPGRVHFGFTGSAELREKLDRVKDIMRHKYPDGHLEYIIGELADDFLERQDPDRVLGRARTSPRTSDRRRVPRWVRAIVWKRDEGRCSFSAPDGRRCDAKAGLEFDHLVPWAVGGRSDTPDNIRLLCRAHNQLEARRRFGNAARRPTTAG